MRLVTFNWNATNLYFITFTSLKTINSQMTTTPSPNVTGISLPTCRTRSPCDAFSHPKWSKDTNGDEKCLFGANLASVTLSDLRSKPLPALNIITVQDKAAWSPCA
jgi:hypothetical protein